jgi:hypothetical protein
LQERLGLDTVDFAYPKALEAPPLVARMIRERFRSAAVAGGGVNERGADPQSLRRVPIQIADGMHWFDRKVAGGLVLEGRIRQVANRMRYAGSST